MQNAVECDVQEALWTDLLFVTFFSLGMHCQRYCKICLLKIGKSIPKKKSNISEGAHLNKNGKQCFSATAFLSVVQSPDLPPRGEERRLESSPASRWKVPVPSLTSLYALMS